MPAIDPAFQMWATFAVVAAALFLYASERLPYEVTSLGVLAVLLLFFHAFPLPGPEAPNILDARRLLEGFANPALIAVLALLVIAQGVVRTGALNRVAQVVLRMGGRSPGRAVALALVFVLAISGILNNTPVVVIFIPILQHLAERLDRPATSVMMPLSFAAILGGMTTLIGSSTNLLVSSALIELGERPLRFFEFTMPGLVLAGVGVVYVLLVAPRLLPAREALAGRLMRGDGKQFIAQITVTEGSKLVGERSKAGMFPAVKDMTVRLVQRGEHAEMPPFEGIELRPGDVLVVAATRKALTEAYARGLGVLQPDLRDGRPAAEAGDKPRQAGEQILAEVMVTPASRLIGQNLEQIGFRYRYGCIVLGLQRRSYMIRARMTRIPLEAGDVLLIQGRPEAIEALRANRDVLLLEWTATELPTPRTAGRAALIFLAVVALAASETVPIVVAAIAGAGAMILAGALNLRQAARAIDRKIVMLVAAALAMSAALEETGGAAYIAGGIIDLIGGSHPATILSAFFLVTALFTNVLSNNACAVLFTPIALGLARGLGIDPIIFAISVVLAANCSFASPIGYQTNLLVMGPGHYRFVDFLRAGLPLTLLLWAVFSLFATWYYGLA